MLKTRRGRMLLGTVVLIVYIIVYCLIAMRFMAETPRLPVFFELIAYTALGVVWIFPVKPLFKWIGRGSADG